MDLPIITKVCTKCNIKKPLNDFHKNIRSKDGHLTVCALCRCAEQAEYRRNNIEKIRAFDRSRNKLPHRRHAVLRQKNPELYKELDKRKRRNPRYRLHANISRRVRESISHGKNGRQWEEILGYSLKDLMHYLQKRFKHGMTWENYGKVWHIDHKIPLKAFNFNSVGNPDFKRCWALSNLQPLFSKENIAKKDTVEYPFQPKLAFEYRSDNKYREKH